MKLDLTKNIKGLDGKDLIDGSAARVLASFLMESGKGNSLKLFEISMKLVDEKPIDIDKEDCKMLKKMVEEGNQMNIVKANIIIALEKVINE